MEYCDIYVNDDGKLCFRSPNNNLETTIDVLPEMIAQSQLTKGITDPHPHDVLAGRGNNVNNHPGNQYFRTLVRYLKNEYVIASKSDKPVFAKLMFQQIRSLKPPGRFLKNSEDGLWEEIDEKKAMDKTRQALREDSDRIKREIDGGLRTVQTVRMKSVAQFFYSI